MRAIPTLKLLLLATTGLFAVSATSDSNVLHEDAMLPFVVSGDRTLAPYGQEMTHVENYSRAAPSVGAGGMIQEGAMETFKGHGFKSVVSLLTPGEGVETHTQWAREAGIDYYNLSVTAEGPGDTVLERFKAILADPENHPVMVHCASANRVGALWARYRIDMGVPVEVAFQEARTIGLQPGLESTVRERFGF
ncbi:beta-lactamase hydrolase domain-containing protein [Marinimicrobium sp. ABcell2]|uniref:beta-lactamase hydrolase domain-containing protein n=1 Tax=Marinimicrobium sp. ABcell2 TaxID=3069751 RepID=UPI0027AE6972|nr:sulfur transferase domain-containing protein [Marinimicrobium sp. ABcell2]MDQ2077783.1 sulfur transferase domain-containing protein [Marinimicrobium sp. ABcell2]